MTTEDTKVFVLPKDATPRNIIINIINTTTTITAKKDAAVQTPEEFPEPDTFDDTPFDSFMRGIMTDNTKFLDKRK